MHKMDFLRGFFEALRNVIEVKITYKDGKIMKISFDEDLCREIDEEDEEDEEPVEEVYKDDCDDEDNLDDDDETDGNNVKFIASE